VRYKKNNLSTTQSIKQKKSLISIHSFFKRAFIHINSLVAAERSEAALGDSWQKTCKILFILSKAKYLAYINTALSSQPNWTKRLRRLTTAVR